MQKFQLECRYWTLFSDWSKCCNWRRNSESPVTREHISWYIPRLVKIIKFTHLLLLVSNPQDLKFKGEKTELIDW